MEVGDLGQMTESPALMGKPIYPYSLSFFLDRVHMLRGPITAGPGNPLLWSEFSPCESCGVG